MEIDEVMEGMDVYESATVLCSFFCSDPPCNINKDMEFVANGDEWCAKNCGRAATIDCWEHAIKGKWYPA